jgi:hypothetical protein
MDHLQRELELSRVIPRADDLSGTTATASRLRPMSQDAELPVDPLPEFESWSIPPCRDSFGDGAKVPGECEGGRGEVASMAVSVHAAVA